MKTIAVSNEKGGVGKTVTTMAVAHGLARSGYRVLVVDLDPQGNSTQTLLGEEGLLNVTSNISQILENKVAAREAIVTAGCLYETAYPGIWLIPSHSDEMSAAVKTQGTDEQQLFFHLSSWAEGLAGRELGIDFVLIDTPPVRGPFLANALYACQYVLVPCNPEQWSMSGFNNIMLEMENLQRKFRGQGRTWQMLGLLLTHFQGRTSLHREVRKELAEHLFVQAGAEHRRHLFLTSDPLFPDPIRFSIVYPGMVSEGVDVFGLAQQYRQTGYANAAEDYGRTVAEILRRLDLPSQKAPVTGSPQTRGNLSLAA